MSWTTEFPILSLFQDQVFQYFLIACNSIAFVVWIITVVTAKHSFMDKLWPILPGFYAYGFLFTSYYYADGKNSNTSITSPSSPSGQYRLILMTAFMTIWGARLAYYFWRRGYYKWDFEDHRWDSVKKKYNYPEKKIAFHIFNFIFMAFMQNWILFGYALPMWYIQTNKPDGFNVLDGIVAVLYFVFFLIEAVADEQQWIFQSRKHKWLKEDKNQQSSNYTSEEIADFKRGFICRGLFAYSRHPNYFGDTLLWWAIYAFSITSRLSEFTNKSFTGYTLLNLFNYSMFSALLMTLLFQRSVQVSEKLTAGKYPEYKHYQSKVGRIWPVSFRPYKPKQD